MCSISPKQPGTHIGTACGQRRDMCSTWWHKMHDTQGMEGSDEQPHVQRRNRGGAWAFQSTIKRRDVSLSRKTRSTWTDVHIRWAAETPKVGVSCEPGPLSDSTVFICSGTVSRTRSVTVRIVYTVNHSLIKLFNLWVKGAAWEEGRRGRGVLTLRQWNATDHQ